MNIIFARVREAFNRRARYAALIGVFKGYNPIEVVAFVAILVEFRILVVVKDYLVEVVKVVRFAVVNGGLDFTTLGFSGSDS